MNIRQGLFRFWVVFSLLWVCFMGFVVFADAQRYMKPIRLTVEGSNFEFPGTASRSTVRAALVTFLNQGKFKGEAAEQSATEISQKFASKDFPEFVFQTSAVLVSAPAILFVLGALLLWIGAGFRRPS